MAGFQPHNVLIGVFKCIALRLAIRTDFRITSLIHLLCLYLKWRSANACDIIILYLQQIGHLSACDWPHYRAITEAVATQLTTNPGEFDEPTSSKRPRALPISRGPRSTTTASATPIWLPEDAEVRVLGGFNLRSYLSWTIEWPVMNVAVAQDSTSSDSVQP